MTTARLAIETTFWERVAQKAAVTGFTWCEADQHGRAVRDGGTHVLIRHGGRVKVFDPAAEAWLSGVIAWLAAGEGGE